MTTISIDIGDIVLVEFPFSDASATKRRPALVMSLRDAYGDMLMLPLTSNPDTPDGIPVTTADMVRGSLPKPSWIKPDKLNCVDSQRVRQVLGASTPALLAEVRARLCPMLGCA